ncbi:hypothetical protein OUZ56_008980 [Daphnia magna]|uniref:Uncharacterized protein n=1 Tax=Daphnia magna TaxID=35525 RepID=A0ABR0AEM6_9CRUS|nr:hypothetical protein OUZ56_008980 [Daphnia magna]
MNALRDTIGQVKAGTKWTHQGYLNVYPTSSPPKRKILELNVLKEFQIKCNLTLSEAALRGVIRNIPNQDSEEDLLNLLADQEATKTFKVFLDLWEEPTLRGILKLYESTLLGSDL